MPGAEELEEEHGAVSGDWQVADFVEHFAATCTGGMPSKARQRRSRMVFAQRHQHCEKVHAVSRTAPSRTFPADNSKLLAASTNEICQS